MVALTTATRQIAQSKLLVRDDDHDSSSSSAPSAAPSSAVRSPPRSAVVIATIAELSSHVARTVQSMREMEDRIVVPMIAQYINQRDQSALNKIVIRKLGVLDSRIHLVGMYETLLESNDPDELDVFRREIPAWPRRLLPRWKRLLYDPRVGGLLAVVVSSPN
jgi:hypothetical protein